MLLITNQETSDGKMISDVWNWFEEVLRDFPMGRQFTPRVPNIDAGTLEPQKWAWVIDLWYNKEKKCNHSVKVNQTWDIGSNLKDLGHLSSKSLDTQEKKGESFWVVSTPPVK